MMSKAMVCLLGLAVVGGSQESESEPLSATFVSASAWSDGGTMGVTLRDGDDKTISFCLTPSDFPPLKLKNGRPEKFHWGASRIYVGAQHPDMKDARLIPIGGDEEAWLIALLDAAILPHRTEEATRARKIKERELSNKRYGGLPIPGGLKGIDTGFNLLVHLRSLQEKRARRQRIK